MGLFLRKNSTIWWIRYGSSGRTVDESSGSHDRRKAEMLLRHRRAEVAQRKLAAKMGLPIAQNLADEHLSLEALHDRYRNHYLTGAGPALRESRARSWRADESALSSVLDFFKRRGATQVGKVTRPLVEAFREWRLTTTVMRRVTQEDGEKAKEACLVSGATVNKGLRIGKACWSWAIRAGLAREPNPFKGVKLIKVPRYDPRNLSDFEVCRVLAAARTASPALFLMLATAIYAGLRLSELVALEWTDVDLVRDLLRVRCDATFIAKSRKPRSVPLAEELREILLTRAAPFGLCFPSEKGARRDPANVRSAFARIGKRAGVAFTPHDLRRTFASLLAARGVPTTRIRDYLGHASLATTEGYYLARGQVEAADVAGLRFGSAPKKSRSERSAGGSGSRETA